MRMSELKGFASQDPMKGETDIASYNSEFKDLQKQLYNISQLDFNGMSLFANYVSDGHGGHIEGNRTTFNGSSQSLSEDHTIDIYTSTKGSAGTKVSLHKSILLSALPSMANFRRSKYRTGVMTVPYDNSAAQLEQA